MSAIKLSNLLSIAIFLMLAANIIQAEQETEENGCPPSAGPITTWTAPVCGKGEWYIQPLFYFTQSKGYFLGKGDYADWSDGIKFNQSQQILFMQYGLTDKWEVSGQLTYQRNYARWLGIKYVETDGAELDEASASGLADTYLYTRYCVLEEKEDAPHVTLLFQLKVPTGKFQGSAEDKYGTDIFGTGSYEPGLGINFTKQIKPFVLHGDLLYSIPSTVTIDDLKTDSANYILYDFGVEYFLPKGFNIMLEFNGFKQGEIIADGVSIVDTNSDYIMMAPGIGWSNETVQTLIAWQRTMSGTNTDKYNTLILTAVIGF